MKLLPTAAVLGLLAVALGPMPAHAVDELPWVRSITQEPATPCPDSAFQLVLRGAFPTACGRVLEARVVNPILVELRVQTPYPAVGFCAPDSITWEHRFPMPGLPAGFNVITMRMVVVDETQPAAPPNLFVAEHPVNVDANCDSLPQPPGPFSFISYVTIGGADPTGTPKLPICPTDSILVRAGGWFPNDCIELRKIEVFPSPIMTPLPMPPIVRFVFDDNGCLDRVCAQVPREWTAGVVLPPLPAMAYQLWTEAALVSCRDTVLPGDPLETRYFPFQVSAGESCGFTPTACLWPSWDHGGNSAGCDTVLDAEGRAGLTMKLATTVALAGLEGVIRVYPPRAGLAIGRIAPIGVAAGMKIQTTPTPDGMRFVLFALAGAPIPPNAGFEDLPILKVSLVSTPVPADLIVPIPDRWTVMAGDLLGADANAEAVPLCPIRTSDGGVRIAPDLATVCRRASCDHNGDGREDVRDLVTMVRCLNGLPPCQVGTGAGWDCQGDGDFDLDDVICCAFSVLGAHPCPECAADSTRPAPEVSLAFGEPSATATGIRVPLRVRGSGLLGGARFELRYPNAAYRVAAIETDRVPAHWLALHAARDGDVGFALVRLGPSLTEEIESLDLALVLEPIAGANGAGEVRVVDAEFSGPDGVRLEVTAAAPAMPIGDAGALALSPASPNPFDGSTTFRLTLGSRTQVTVGVYDLAGRRVASLHDGVLPVGVHPFTWDGRRSDGSRAAGGVYFYRAESGGRVTARKMVLLGGR